jgi:hypothetical protein
MRSVPLVLIALGLLDACSGDSNVGERRDGAVDDSGAGGRSTSNDGGAGRLSSGGTPSSTGGGKSSGGVANGGRAGSSTGGGAGTDAGMQGTGSGGVHADAAVESGTSNGGAGGGGPDAAAGAGGTSADAGQEAGADSATAPVTIDIVSAKTAFRDYGKLRIGFAQAVNPATLTIALSPAQPAALAVTSVSAVDATTVDATLSYYHLPRDYQLTVSGKLADGVAFTAATTIPGLGNGSRIAFLTKQTGSGDFKTWPNAPASATTALEAADGICQAEATAAGFRGTFAAFLSAKGAYDAGCRLLGTNTTVAAHCGQATTPVDHAPWLALDGLPIALGGTAVLADAWDLPIPFSADGTQPLQALVWTGSTLGAVAQGLDCTGWTTTSGFTSMAIFLDQYLLTYDGGSSCSDNRSLACFQVKGNFFGPSTLHQVQGRRVFVTKQQLGSTLAFGGSQGVKGADALCASEATTAGYANPSGYHAYVGTSTDDAMCHALGKTGTVANHCGLAALPTDVSWRRFDGYPVGTVAQLVANDLTAPIIFAADGTRHVKDRPWTGIRTSNAGLQNCSDWTSTSSNGTAFVGIPSTTTSGWQFFSTGNCNTSAPVYCFEQ